MGRKSTLNSLPANVSAELLHRYFEQPSLTIDDHHNWLADQGYEHSRSSLHRYLLGKSESPEAQEISEDRMIRMRCLEVASSVYSGSDQAGLIDFSDSLFSYVRYGKTQD